MHFFIHSTLSLQSGANSTLTMTHAVFVSHALWSIGSPAAKYRDECTFGAIKREWKRLWTRESAVCIIPQRKCQSHGSICSNFYLSQNFFMLFRELLTLTSIRSSNLKQTSDSQKSHAHSTNSVSHCNMVAQWVRLPPHSEELQGSTHCVKF